MSKLLSRNKNCQIYFSLAGMKVLTNEELKLKGWTKGGKGWGSEEAKRYLRDVLHFTGADVDGKIGAKSLVANDKLVNPFYVKNIPVGIVTYSDKPLDFKSDNYAVGELEANPDDLKLIAKAKQYGFDAKSVNQIKAILSELQSRGLYSGKVDGIWGPKTLAAYELAKQKPVVESNSSKDDLINTENRKRFVSNIVKHPVRGAIDAGLYLADKKGAPSNAMNFIRDLNVSLPYRAAAYGSAAIETLFDNDSFLENYEQQLANPNAITKSTTIKPLINTASNFTPEQLEVIKRMAGDKSRITSADIIKETSDHRYGKADLHYKEYFTPEKVVQTALGLTSGRDGYLTDIFDFNTLSELAKKDNEKYSSQESKGLTYGNIRKIAPRISSLDIMPDNFKVKTILNLNEI